MSRIQTDVDKFAVDVAGMDRQRVMHEISTFHGRFPLDFTVEHLEHMSVEQLRHILMAALLQDQSD